jgi:hypothetical protein
VDTSAKFRYERPAHQSTGLDELGGPNPTLAKEAEMSNQPIKTPTVTHESPVMADAPVRRPLARSRAALTAMLISLTVLCGAFVSTAAPASAAINWPNQWSHTWAPNNDNGGWVNVRSCSSGCGTKFSLYGWSPVKMLCWTNGTYAYGTAKWFYIYSNSANNYGYVNAAMIPDQVWSPAC